jgi:hypothetical protein
MKYYPLPDSHINSWVIFRLWRHYYYLEEISSSSTSSLRKSTPNITANVRHASLYECAVRAMRKKLKLSSGGDDSGNKKCKQSYGGAYGGVW